MFSKSLFASIFIGALTTQVAAHAIIEPPLGVSGTPARSDVQRPATGKECGTINVASTIDTSTAVAAAADGSFAVTGQDFNAGTDGGLQVTATVDATGTGTSFPGKVTITKNGDADPTAVETDQITASLPAGTTCTGGTTGNLCLVSFVTNGGFGNCVVVSQGAAAAATTNSTTTGTTSTTGTTTNSTTTGTASTAGTGTNSTTTGTTTDSTTGTAAAANGTTTDSTTGTAAATNGTTTGKKHHHHKGAAAAAAGSAANATAQAVVVKVKGDKQAGTRAPRAALFEDREIVARNVWNWMWA